MKLTYTKRCRLYEYLQKKVTIADIAEYLNVSRQAIYDEIKRGTTPEEYGTKQYESYDPDKAQKELGNPV